MLFGLSKEYKRIEKHKNPRNRCFFGEVEIIKASRIPKTREIDASLAGQEGKKHRIS
jgi:hypothetical protein